MGERNTKHNHISRKMAGDTGLEASLLLFFFLRLLNVRGNDLLIFIPSHQCKAFCTWCKLCSSLHWKMKGLQRNSTMFGIQCAKAH